MSQPMGDKIQHTVMATNTDFDSILVVDDDDRVLSAWQADNQMIRTFLEIGAYAERWQTGVWPPGFTPDRYKDREYAQKLRAIVGYGVECGRDGEITEDYRYQLWNLPD